MLTGQILFALIIILITIQIVGSLCRLIGQQWVIGEILAGLALGPSLLGLLFPSVQHAIFPASALSTLQVFGDVGLVLYMFALGARLDTGLMLRQSRTALVASLSGILFPFILGAIIGRLLFHSFGGRHATLLSFSLLVGTTISITAFPVLARLLTEKKMLGSRIGLLALTCASVNDVIAWCLLAFVIATSHKQGPLFATITVGETALFILVMLFAVRPLFRLVVNAISSQTAQIALSMILLLATAAFTNYIGIHPVFGAFVAGVIMPRNVIFTRQIRSIDTFNNILFLPIFFVFSGLRTQIGLIQSPLLWLICIGIILMACLGKIFGGTLSVRVMGESWRDAFSLGILMNTRGLVELIGLNIGYDLGILSPTIFAMLVLMALVTTMMASPFLYWLGYRTPGQPTPSTEDAYTLDVDALG
jgi:Kef-type K+ transport system membrane component KefB